MIVDFEIPTTGNPPPGEFALLTPGDGATELPREMTLAWEASTGADTYSLKIATDPGLNDTLLDLAGLTATSYEITGPVLDPCADYYWGVTAVNAAGQTDSTPMPAQFSTAGIADMNGDATINTLDVLTFLNLWSAGETRADVNLDGTINTLDVLFYLNAYASGC